MTSPNFGENFKRVFERVAVQMRLQNLWKIILKEIEFKDNNLRNNSTDKRNVFFKRVYKSNNIFERFPLGGKTPQFRRKEWF
jgi:hypothetical protein